MRKEPNWRIRVFGGGTALPSAQRDNTYLALELEADSTIWLIDCGGSPYQNLLLAGLSPMDLAGVVLTHAHTDHIYGLPALLVQLFLAGYSGCLEIYGLEETLRVARQVVQAFALDKHCAQYRWCVIDVGARGLVQLFERGVRFWAGRVRHSLPTIGVRIEGADGGILTYSSDTSPCAGLIALARGAHWLLHECTVDQPMEGHSTPEEIARTALQAGVGSLGVVHYDPLYVVKAAVLRERVRQAGFSGGVVILDHLEAIHWCSGAS